MMSDADYLCLKDTGISSDKHALIIPPFMSRGKRIHPMPFSDSATTCKCVMSLSNYVCSCFSFFFL